MPRCHGSLIGAAITPTQSDASGVWTLREAQEYLEADAWPAQPAVPAAPTATAGDGEVSLVWMPLTTQPPITDYGIQYSDDAGVTWTTFTDGVGDSTSATVTGLTNDTAYIFRLYGVNALGTGPYGSASASVTPTVAALDVALLLHFDGTNGSTSFTDASPNALTVTAYGDAQISTAQSKFGGGSLLLDGGGDYVTTSAAPVDFGTGDFTVSAWIRATSVSGYLPIMRAGAWVLYGYEGTLYWGVPYVSNDLSGSYTPATDQWVHFAASRSGDTLKLFVDGVAVASGTNTASYGGASSNVTIGEYASGYLSAYVDEAMVLNGTALYTANFTPPTAPF